MWLQTEWRSQIFLGGVLSHGLSLVPWSFTARIYSALMVSSGLEISGLTRDKSQGCAGTVLSPRLASPDSSSRRELIFLGATLKWPRAQVKRSWFCQNLASHISTWWKSILLRKMEGDFMKYLVLPLVCTQWVISLPFFVNWPAAGACCCLMFSEMCPSGGLQAWH